MIKRSSRRTCGVASALTLAIAACGGSPLGPDPTDACASGNDCSYRNYRNYRNSGLGSRRKR